MHNKNSHLLNWTKSEGHRFVPTALSFLQHETDMQMLQESVRILRNNSSPTLEVDHHVTLACLEIVLSVNRC